MKLIRFALAGRAQHGSLEGDQIQPLEGELHALTAVLGAKAIPLGSVKLLTPTAASKVIAIGPGRRRVLGAVEKEVCSRRSNIQLMSTFSVASNSFIARRAEGSCLRD